MCILYFTDNYTLQIPRKQVRYNLTLPEGGKPLCMVICHLVVFYEPDSIENVAVVVSQNKLHI